MKKAHSAVSYIEEYNKSLQSLTCCCMGCRGKTALQHNWSLLKVMTGVK